VVNLHHFYHIYCGLDVERKEGSWKLPVETHVEALKKYKLTDYLSTMHVGLVGNDSHRQQVQDFLTEHEINFTIVSEAQSGWEQVTQNQLYEFAKSNDGYILYGHSKSSFNSTQQNIDWCKSMVYFNVVQWSDCIDRLTDYDAIGCYWFDFSGQAPPHLGGPHVGQRWFAGTYWWSKLNRIRDIGHGPTMHTRWDAEVWIGQIPGLLAYDLTGPETQHHNAIITEW
jgi:hypothetical protein